MEKQQKANLIKKAKKFESIKSKAEQPQPPQPPVEQTHPHFMFKAPELIKSSYTNSVSINLV